MSLVKVRCPRCDSENDLDREACVKCGRNLNTSAPDGH